MAIQYSVKGGPKLNVSKEVFDYHQQFGQATLPSRERESTHYLFLLEYILVYKFFDKPILANHKIVVIELHRLSKATFVLY